MVSFDPETHTYYAEDGRVLPSVTQVLQAVGLAPDYGNVPEEVLRRKAERGTHIHKEIEDFIKNGEIGFSKEFGEFAREFGNGCSDPESEVILSNDEIAGTCDLRFKRNGEKTLADYKTTATLHREYVRWQLSLYAYLDGSAINRVEAWHFAPEGLKIWATEPRTKEEVEEVLRCYREGRKYQPPAPIDEGKLMELEEAEKAIEDLKKKIAEHEERKKAIMDALCETMEATGTKSYEGERVKITYVAPCEKKTIDAKKLKEEKPEIYESYLKTTMQKASVRITLKGKKDA